MYFPYLRGRQFELIALRELVEARRISEKIIPIVEPLKPSATLLKTIQAFVETDRDIAIILNSEIGDFSDDLQEMCQRDSRIAIDLMELLNSRKVIMSYIMTDKIIQGILSRGDKDQFLVINHSRDCLDDFLTVYEDTLPRFVLIPDDRAFKREISNNKVLLEDGFNKKFRNVEYLDDPDEFFSDNHLYFQDENFIGFADYSVIGEEFNESGFAPVAVAIHIVYFDDKGDLRVHHFVSDSNEGIEDPAGKFGEAVEKLVTWCGAHNVSRTLGLQGFYDCYNQGKYPGLGTVKKYSIMHHLELISNFLEEGQ